MTSAEQIKLQQKPLTSEWHNQPSSSSYSVYGRTPLWCLHKLAAAGGTRKTCACPRVVCERGLTCESSLWAGTPQTEDLQKFVDVAGVEPGKVVRFLRRDRKQKTSEWHRSREIIMRAKTRYQRYYMSLTKETAQHTTTSLHWISAKKVTKH